MSFKHFYLVLMSAIWLSFAGCNSKSGANGGSDGSNAASGDTISIQGSIESVSLRDSMIVFKTDKGLDTVFYDKNTQFTIGDPGKVLRPQSQIDVKYVKMNKRKMAVKVQPAATSEDTTKR